MEISLPRKLWASRCKNGRSSYNCSGRILVTAIQHCMIGIVIRGDGIAARACAHLLGAAGIGVAIETTRRPSLPAIMVGESTQGLFRDVFGRTDLFRGARHIEKRIVAWGPDAKPLALPHSAVVVSEDALLNRLKPPRPVTDQQEAIEVEWTILASRPLPPSSTECRFGTRIAAAQAVNLKNGCDATACWVESLENGWLFLLPSDRETGWLLGVGGPPDSLLGLSRLVGDQIQGTSGVAAKFPAYPRINWPLSGPGWLACGTAALAFDPLCGDGTGYAIREGILASAVVQAAAKHTDSAADLGMHYRKRLLIGFQRHLEACRNFYASGHRGPWWDAELDLASHGVEWCARELGSATKFRYQLRGFELQLAE